MINLLLIKGASPFVRDPDEIRRGRPEHGLQGRVGFVDDVGVYVHSNGGRCTAAFDEDTYKIDGSDLLGPGGTFLPWGSVVRLSKVQDAAQYEAAWQQNERDSEAYYNANGEYPSSNTEFFQWRNSLSNTAYEAAYNASRSD
ncbi:hypothetical protein A9Z40_01975 [Microbacterium arborescens]|uniref:Uncharacterized protein n=1 Tax=Microbacterium arborescens TaxID=33883 RepID=A0ABX2WJN1_9MICO|nr:hypothetical protein A9Z40_01975 [Microbacterium arborescens]